MLRDRVPEQWSSVAATIGTYWETYGGLRSLLSSPYFALSVITTVVVYSYAYLFEAKLDWTQNIFDVVPSLLGFSIGAFAVLLVFSGDRFQSLIVEEGVAGSLFMKTSALFVHFIVVQSLCVLMALLAKVWGPFSPIAFFLLTYSLFTAVAAALALFNLAMLYNAIAHSMFNGGADQAKNGGEEI